MMAENVVESLVVNDAQNDRNADADDAAQANAEIAVSVQKQKHKTDESENQLYLCISSWKCTRAREW